MKQEALKDKHVLFIGGCGGIGKPTVVKLLLEGAKVSITSPVIGKLTDEAKGLFENTIKENGFGDFHIIEADITKESDLTRQVKEAQSKFGNIDHLVIMAGVSHLGKMLDVTREEWDLIMDVNAWGVFRTIQESYKHLEKGANIVVVGSDVGLGKPSHDIPLYSVSKATLHSILQLLSQELPEYGISVSGIAPYNTPPGMKRVYQQVKERLLCEPEDCETPDWGNLPPTGKFIEGNSLAELVSFLLKTSGDFNGSIIPVTGGYGYTVS
ncbi:SDR family oxidoreductase [Patescibacteria group bacterium]|nr:SDR family oxidoreductase [Patescibacteria group bacterium]